MLDSNTAHDQQALLATHRRTLSYLLEKAKKYEGVALAPPEVRHGIDQARSEIERIKRALSEQSIEVADEEGDTPTAGEEGGAIGMVWKRTRVSLLVVVLLTGVFVATSFLSALTNIGPAREQLQSWGWWPLPFVPGQPGETLIVVMPFFLPQGGNDPDDAANEIFNHISQDVEKANLSNVRVELMEGRQFRAEDRAKAEAFGKSVGASIIVWGTNTGVKVQVNYLNLRQPDFDAADVIVKRLKEQAGEAQTQPANPTPYARYVTDDLPRMISFLSLFAVGQAAFVQDNYSQAAQIIEQGLATVQGVSQIDSQQAEAYFRLGWLREELGQIQQAISAYDRAIAINPNAPSSYNNRGILLKEQGDLVGTRADYDQAIALDSTFSEAYYNRGILSIIARSGRGEGSDA